jgi:hypothetical protein
LVKAGNFIIECKKYKRSGSNVWIQNYYSTRNGLFKTKL